MEIHYQTQTQVTKRSVPLLLGCVGPQSEQAGKVSSCQGCPNQNKCSSGEFRKPDPGFISGT